GIVPDADRSEDGRARPHDHVVLERRGPLSLVPARPPPRHAVVQRDGLPDLHPHPMIDEKPFADRRSRMDLDSREGSRDVGDEPGENPDVALPEPVGEVVEPYGVETGIAEEDLQHAACGRIPLEDDLDVVPDRSEHLPLPAADIIRPNMSISSLYHEKGKDFLQAFPLAALRTEKLFR